MISSGEIGNPKRLLIVGSTPLNPVETFPSTFELSQAKILSRAYRVAILSVRGPLGSGGRALARRLITAPKTDDLKSLGELFKRCADHLRGFREVNVHNIEGVTVYEGVALRSPFEQGFEAELRAWLAGANAAFAEYCSAEGVPDLVHAHGKFLNAGAFALEARKSKGIPYVYTEHSSNYSRGLAPNSSKPILNEIIDQAAAYCAVSPFLAETVAHFLGRDDRVAIIIPNVVDEIFEQHPPLAPPETGPVVFMNVATLYPHKGLEFLLRAFAEAFGRERGYVLKFCGDGPQQRGLEELADRLGVRDGVKFLGHVSKWEVLRQIDDAHAVVLSSTIETFGVALIEAMARGRPVIATRCGGPNNIVTEGCGTLVEKDNIQEMAEALRQTAKDIKSYDPVTIRENALATYGSKAFLSRISSVYQAALADVR